MPDALTLALHHHTFELLHIPGGVFRMGDVADDLWEACRPVHEVRVGDFYLGRYPVTQALWKAVMQGENPSYFKGDERPVDTVSWEDIHDRFLPKLNRLLPGHGFRLPTEAEWEYAARGGPHRQNTLYAGSDDPDDVAWYDANSHDETKPVGLKYPNALGLYDLSGNVWEWCADWYAIDYYEQCRKQGLVENPKGPERGDNRVQRGGSNWNDPQNCRVAYRNNDHPANRNDNIGFRLAVSFQFSG